MNARGCFVAGTDTGVGKTRVTVGLLRCGRDMGIPVLGMKPVSAGGLEDAAMIAAVTGQIVDPRDLSTYALPEPISPHIAAERAGICIETDVIYSHFSMLSHGGHYCVVEGAGGWLTPINSVHTMADVAIRLQLPVVLVIGLRLGCLNHTLLTAAAIQQSGLPLAGWIGNRIDPAQQAAEENIATLAARLGAPLGILPWSSNPEGEHVHLMHAARRLFR